MPRGRPRKTNDLLGKSAEFLGWALGGLEREIAQTRERLSALTEQANRLRARIGRSGARPAREAAPASGTEPAAPGRKRRRRKMSAEARKKISEAMTKRWAERRKRNA